MTDMTTLQVELSDEAMTELNILHEKSGLSTSALFMIMMVKKGVADGTFDKGELQSPRDTLLDIADKLEGPDLDGEDLKEISANLRLLSDYISEALLPLH